MQLLTLLFACREPVLEVIPGVTTSVEVTLLNPTDCPVCDPFVDIDTLRVDVAVGHQVVASDSFAWPGEDVVLPDLEGFGVVRISLVGLADGRVLSAGRTAEIVLLPDQELSVPMVFVPANRTLPLAGDMIADRYRGASVIRRDGTVLLVGGLDPMRQRATGTTEIYDPSTGSFSDFGPLPTAGVAAPSLAALPGGSTIFTGGYAVLSGGEVPVEDAFVFDDAAGVFEEAGTLSQGRTGHCVAMFRERQGIVLGGAAGAAEYLKPQEGTETWGFEALEMRDFDPGAVTDCVVLPDGTVFVQGGDAASTGIWSGGDKTSNPAQAFAPIVAGAAGDVRYVEGPSMFATADGEVHVLGGADAETGEVYADARLYVPEARRFTSVSGFRTARFDPAVTPWIEDGWYAVGCGWADAERAEGDGSIEILSPEVDGGSPLFELDRPRPGCTLSGLSDGSVLVAGGGDLGPASGPAAALLVPWFDEAPGG